MTPDWRRWAQAPILLAAEARARADPGDIGRAVRLFDAAARAGDGPRARAAARRCLEALVGAPERLAAEIGANAPTTPRNPGVDEDAALAALDDLLALARAADVRPFLVFGALLGVVRDGRFIPGDSDLDLGVIGGDALARLRAAAGTSRLASSETRRVDGRPAELTIAHANGCQLDLKAFEPEADGALSWTLSYKRLRLRKRYPGGFDLTDIAFRGRSVAAPDPPEAFLEWQYGPGWRAPDPGYSVYASGPAHGAAHRAFLSIMGPKTALGALRRGRADRALAAARSMAELFPEDELWPRVIAAVEAAVSRPGADPAGPGPGRSGRSC